MLYQIGMVTFEGNAGPSAEGVERKTDASLAEKGLLGGLPRHEWTGWSGEMSLSGSVLPFHLGGLGDVADLHSCCEAGTVMPVLRGDGAFLGWYAIKTVQERHKSLARNGIGYEVEWSLSLVRQPAPAGSEIETMIGLVSNLIERLASTTAGAVASAVTSLFG